ncbi:hypothetical protein QTP88_023080 [Uroleucon formosanum]
MDDDGEFEESMRKVNLIALKKEISTWFFNPHNETICIVRGVEFTLATRPCSTVSELVSSNRDVLLQLQPRGIIKDLSSKNEAKSRVGMLRAEELLGDGEKTWDESSLKTVQNGTTINRKAFEDLGKPKDEIPSDAGLCIQHDIISSRPSAIRQYDDIDICFYN